MLITSSLFFILSSQYVVQSSTAINKAPTVFIAILARNKEITLPYFLSLLQDQDYPKDRISLWISSDHNQDNTITVLEKWLSSVSDKYHSIVTNFDKSGSKYPDELGPAHWSLNRFNNVINLREKALNSARAKWADFILVCHIFLGYVLRFNS